MFPEELAQIAFDRYSAWCDRVDAKRAALDPPLPPAKRAVQYTKRFYQVTGNKDKTFVYDQHNGTPSIEIPNDLAKGYIWGLLLEESICG